MKQNNYIPKSFSTDYKPCYKDHKALKIVVGTNTYKIFGGSCSTPTHKDADVYIGLDYSMKITPNVYPWNGGGDVLFSIKDMSVPTDVKQFKNLINWIAVQLIANKKVHVGCVGGHGRTGLVLAALVKIMTGDDNAISYVRDNYCKKSVESQKQISFLEKHFDIIPVKPVKAFSYSTGSNYNINIESKRYEAGELSTLGHGATYKPKQSKLSIW